MLSKFSFIRSAIISVVRFPLTCERGAAVWRAYMWEKGDISATACSVEEKWNIGKLVICTREVYASSRLLVMAHYSVTPASDRR